MDGALFVLFNGLIAVLATFLIFWVISLLIKNPSIIDICWGIGFIVISYVFIISGAGWTLRNTLMFSMILLWGLRISYFVTKRLNFGKIEDHRYVIIREKWKSYIGFNFLVFFVFQAVIEIFVALSIYFVALNNTLGLSLLELIGLAIWFIAFVAEAAADEQLENFKKKPENKGKVCQEGLWNYSRHPNYFFEFLIWVAFFIYALPSPWGWLSIISPLIMLHLVLNVSGVAFAERLSVQRRGEAYKEYQRTTSKFIPLPKRAI